MKVRVRWTVHAACMGAMINTYTISAEKYKYLGDFGVDEMIILKTILNKLSV
jgi:hypothetical protein